MSRNILTQQIIEERFAKYNLIPLEKYINSKVKIKVRCHCQNEFFTTPFNIFNGDTTSCGCYRKLSISERCYKDITGLKFNKLLVVEKTDDRNSNGVIWKCRCDCGKICYITCHRLISNHTQSCGCLKSETTIARNKLMVGENSPNWNPNLTNEDRDLYKYKNRCKDWSTAILKRDNYTCRCCNTIKSPFNAHHLYNWADYPELRYDLENGVCLCVKCHYKFHKIYGQKNNTKQQFLEFQQSYEKT